MLEYTSLLQLGFIDIGYGYDTDEKKLEICVVEDVLEFI